MNIRKFTCKTLFMRGEIQCVHLIIRQPYFHRSVIHWPCILEWCIFTAHTHTYAFMIVSLILLLTWIFHKESVGKWEYIGKNKLNNIKIQKSSLQLWYINPKSNNVFFLSTFQTAYTFVFIIPFHFL